MGFSVISLVEFLYYFSVKPIIAFYRNRKLNKIKAIESIDKTQPLKVRIDVPLYSYID